MGRRPTNARVGDAPLFRDQGAGRGFGQRIDSGAFQNNAPNYNSQIADTIRLTRDDIKQAEQRRQAQAEQARKNAVKNSLLKAKITHRNFVDNNRDKYGADPQGYASAWQGHIKGFNEEFDTSQFSENDLLQLQIDTDDLYRSESNRRQDDYLKAQDNQFELSVLESADVAAENANSYGESLATAQEDDLPELVGTNRRNELELDDLLTQRKSDGTYLFTPEQQEAKRDELQFRNWSAYGITLGSRGGNYDKIAKDVEDNKLMIPVDDGKGGVAFIPIRDYLQDPKLVDKIANEIRAEGKRVKADREAVIELENGADYFWGRKLYNQNDTDSTKAYSAYEELAYDEFIKAPALDGTNANSNDEDFDGKSKVDIALPFLVNNGELPKRIKGYYDAALQTDNVDAWLSAGAIIREGKAQNNFTNDKLLSGDQYANVIQFNHYVGAGLEPELAIQKVLELRDRKAATPTLTKQRQDEWNDKTDSVALAEKIKSFGTFDESTFSGQASILALASAGENANIIGRNHYVLSGDDDASQEIGLDSVATNYGVTHAVGKGQAMAYPPEANPAFRGHDPKNLDFRNQANVAIQQGIARLDKEIIPENLQDNVVLVVDGEFLQYSLRRDGRVPYRIKMKGTDGRVYDITNADGTDDDPLLFTISRRNAEQQKAYEANQAKEREANIEAEAEKQADRLRELDESQDPNNLTDAGA